MNSCWAMSLQIWWSPQFWLWNRTTALRHLTGSRSNKDDAGSRKRNRAPSLIWTNAWTGCWRVWPMPQIPQISKKRCGGVEWCQIVGRRKSSLEFLSQEKQCMGRPVLSEAFLLKAQTRQREILLRVTIRGRMSRVICFAVAQSKLARPRLKQYSFVAFKRSSIQKWPCSIAT